MSNTIKHIDRYDAVEIDLRNPAVAAVLAWLWPGAGHLYQRRIAKGMLYMVCILVTYFWGLAMGGGHVVYASWKSKNDAPQNSKINRYPFLGQIGVGLPALPAVFQMLAAEDGKRIFDSAIMAPPRSPVHEQRHDELAIWHEKLGFYFELGTLYTTIAGLLNMLVIYDAFAGPVFADPKNPDRKTEPPTKAPETANA